MIKTFDNCVLLRQIYGLLGCSAKKFLILGPKGDRGTIGQTGSRGPTGQKGSKGDMGYPGIPGNIECPRVKVTLAGPSGPYFSGIYEIISPKKVS